MNWFYLYQSIIHDVVIGVILLSSIYTNPFCKSAYDITSPAILHGRSQPDVSTLWSCGIAWCVSIRFAALHPPIVRWVVEHPCLIVAKQKPPRCGGIDFVCFKFCDNPTLIVYQTTTKQSTNVPSHLMVFAILNWWRDDCWITASYKPSYIDMACLGNLHCKQIYVKAVEKQWSPAGLPRKPTGVIFSISK